MSSKSLFWKESVENLPLKKPIVVHQNETVSNAIREMQNNSRGSVLVYDDAGTMIGIFTEHDVMKKYIGTPVAPTAPVKDVMTPNPIMMTPNTTVAEAAAIIKRTQKRHFPIGKDTKSIIGLLSVRILVHFMAENLPQEVMNLPPDGPILPKTLGGG